MTGDYIMIRLISLIAKQLTAATILVVTAMEIMYNIIDRCVSSKQSPHYSKSDDQNVLANPDGPRETAEPAKLVPDSPEDQDREERGKDEC